MKKKMCDLAHKEQRRDYQWGVVHSGNAICCAIFRIKRLAEQYRKSHACAYVVVPVIIIPDYGKDVKEPLQ